MISNWRISVLALLLAACGSATESTPIAACARTPVAASFCERADGLVGLSCDANPEPLTCGQAMLSDVFCCRGEPLHTELDLPPAAATECEIDRAVTSHCATISAGEGFRCSGNPDPARCAELPEFGLPDGARRADAMPAFCCVYWAEVR